MKKITIYVICLLMIFTLIACKTNTEQPSSNTNTNETVNQTTDDSNSDPICSVEFKSIQGSSLQEFNEKFLGTSVQASNQNIILLRSATNLSFENHDMQFIEYTEYDAYDGVFTGDVSLNIYWHNKTCHSCLTPYCELLNLYLLYSNDEESWLGITRGFTQTDNPNLYIAEGSFNNTSYAYLINNHYACIYTVKNDLPEKNLIVEQITEFCNEFANSLNNDTVIK